MPAAATSEKNDENEAREQSVKEGEEEARKSEQQNFAVQVCRSFATALPLLPPLAWICTVCFKMFSIFILPSLHFYLRFSPLTTRLKGAQRSAL